MDFLERYRDYKRRRELLIKEGSEMAKEKRKFQEKILHEIVPTVSGYSYTLLNACEYDDNILICVNKIEYSVRWSKSLNKLGVGCSSKYNNKSEAKSEVLNAFAPNWDEIKTKVFKPFEQIQN